MFIKRMLGNLKYAFVPALILLALAYIILPQGSHHFNERGYKVSEIYRHMTYLSSPEMKGRLAGSEENRRAEDYIRNEFKKSGLIPLKGNAYDQPFSAQVPYFGKESTFSFPNLEGGMENMLIYKDFRYYTFSFGGSIDYKGDLLYVGRNFFNVPLELLKDKVVVLSVTGYSKDVEDRAIAAGVKGIYVYRMGDDPEDEKLPRMKSLSMSDKPGPSMGFAVIGREMARTIERTAEANKLSVPGISADEFVGVIHHVSIKQQIDYKTVKMNNLLGMIPGKNKKEYVFFSAHFDHIGNARGDAYFPGAVDNASGTAMILEMARWCQSQKVTPEKNIVFVAWNAEEAGLKGSDYYVRHPLVPLANTENVNLDMVGSKNLIVDLAYLDKPSEVLASKFKQYADSIKVKTTLSSIAASDHYSFYIHGTRAVMLSQLTGTLHEVTDTMENGYSEESMTRVAKLMGLYLNHDVYGNIKPDYFNFAEKMGFTLVACLMMLCYIVERGQQNRGTGRLVDRILVGIRYHRVYQVLKKSLNLVLPMIIVVLLASLAQLPKDLNIIKTATGYESNFSIYLMMQKTVLYIRGLMQHGVGITADGIPIWPTVQDAFFKSFSLLLGTLLLAFPLAVFKGMGDSIRDHGKKGWRSFSGMLMLSIPDILWIFLANMVMIFIGNQEALNKWLTVEFLKGWLMPWLTLTIMPYVYLSRVAYVAFEEEKAKPYAVALKSRGYGKRYIYVNHLLRTVIEKVLDSTVGLTAVLISNMIVVEYLFDYKGLANHVLLAKDQTLSSTLVMALTLLYFINMLILKTTGFLLSPRKRQQAMVTKLSSNAEM